MNSIKKKWDTKSIAFKFIVFVILLVIVQSSLLIITLIAGGIISEAEKTAVQSFQDKVSHQEEYLFREMSNRWTNIDPYVNEIASKFPMNETEKTDEFFTDITPTLLSMLRTTTANGAFIILDQVENNNRQPALYFRDYDTLLNDELNKDVTCLFGPANLCHSLRLQFNEYWTQQIELTEENQAFYTEPARVAHLEADPKLLSYWSKPFQLSENDVKIITYTMPIYDDKKVFRGVIGIELLVDGLTQFLPGTDLLGRDELSYFIGYKDVNSDGIVPLITNGAVQNRIVPSDEPIILTPFKENDTVFKIDNLTTSTEVFASMQNINFYYPNTPFEQEEWYLIGLTTEDNLLGYINRLKNILLVSFLGSILIGGIGSYFIGRRLTSPIVDLAKQVRKSDRAVDGKLDRTGLTEIDDLSLAIETANQNLLDSTLKLSRIIDLVDEPIGAFEYKESEPNVFMTDQLKQILLQDDQLPAMYEQKTIFIERLQYILKCPESEEQNVYKVSDYPAKWVRLNMMTDAEVTLGIVMDVTEEMLDKQKIKLERDHDTLTQIYNRGAYKRVVTNLLECGGLKTSACIMFDLDFLKHVNDSFGHKWGDVYIAKTAEYLNMFSNEKGIVGRISGDEFSVFLYGYHSQKEIRQLIEKFYHTLEQNPIQFPTELRSIRISGGVYWLAEDDLHVYDEIVAKADTVLYEAKRYKKGGWLEFSKELI